MDSYSVPVLCACGCLMVSEWCPMIPKKYSYSCQMLVLLASYGFLSLYDCLCVHGVHVVFRWVPMVVLLCWCDVIMCSYWCPIIVFVLLYGCHIVVMSYDCMWFAHSCPTVCLLYTNCVNATLACCHHGFLWLSYGSCVKFVPMRAIGLPMDVLWLPYVLLCCQVVSYVILCCQFVSYCCPTGVLYCAPWFLMMPNLLSYGCLYLPMVCLWCSYGVLLSPAHVMPNGCPFGVLYFPYVILWLSCGFLWLRKNIRLLPENPAGLIWLSYECPVVVLLLSVVVNVVLRVCVPTAVLLWHTSVHVCFYCFLYVICLCPIDVHVVCIWFPSVFALGYQWTRTGQQHAP